VVLASHFLHLRLDLSLISCGEDDFGVLCKETEIDEVELFKFVDEDVFAEQSHQCGTTKALFGIVCEETEIDQAKLFEV